MKNGNLEYIWKITKIFICGSDTAQKFKDFSNIIFPSVLRRNQATSLPRSLDISCWNKIPQKKKKGKYFHLWRIVLANNFRGLSSNVRKVISCIIPLSYNKNNGSNFHLWIIDKNFHPWKIDETFLLLQKLWGKIFIHE